MKQQNYKIIYKMLICSVLLVICVGCRRPQSNEIQEQKSISDFTLHENFLYFGAGYNLCRVDLSLQSFEILYTTDSILVGQPEVDDNVVYFGGYGLVNEKGRSGSKDSFFALDIQTKKLLWKFKFPSAYGTFGTYPILVNNKILVCGRNILYCLDTKNGKIIWGIRNWFGLSDGTPCVVGNKVVYRINRGNIDKGGWAVVSLDNGKQIATITAPKDTQGQSLGVVYDGVLYLTTRYNNSVPRDGYFGAIDIINKKLLWEVGNNFSRSRPAVNNSFVYACKNNPTPPVEVLLENLSEATNKLGPTYQKIAALNKQTGEIVWEKRIEEFDFASERPIGHVFLSGIRLTVTEEEVFVKGVKTIASFDALNGEKLWSRECKADYNTSNPIIIGSEVFISDLSDSLIIAVDLKSGKELRKLEVPVSSIYLIEED